MRLFVMCYENIIVLLSYKDSPAICHLFTNQQHIIEKQNIHNANRKIIYIYVYEYEYEYE